MKQSMDDLIKIREDLKKDPDDPYALKAAGKHYLTEGHFKLAKNSYLQAVSVLPRLFPQIMLDYEEELEKEPEKMGTRLSLAGFRLVLGDKDGAILELEEALDKNPKCVEAYNVLGKIFIKEEKIDETIALLERSIQEGIKDVALIEILACAYLEKGRIKDAAKFYREVLEYKPGDKQILRVMGELYLRLNDYHQAAFCYQAMFSDDPHVSREVIQRLEELLRKTEGSILIREILADIYMKSLKPELAVEKLKEIVRLESAKLEEVVSKLKTILKNYPGHPQTSLALGEVLRVQSNFSEAAENYHNLLNLRPEFVSEVISGYQEILRFCPEQILARNYLAEAYLYKNQIKEALLEFERIVQTDSTLADKVVRKCREILKSHPQFLLAHLVLAKAYMAKGEVQRSVTEAEGLVAIDKKFTQAYLLLGEAYFQLKLCRRAVETLRLALSLDPYNLLVQEKYRQVKEKELDMEINATREKINRDQWKVSLRLDLAKCYLKSGQEEDAIRELQVALKDQARAPFAANLLGCIYRGEGRYDLAAAQFNRALPLVPGEIADLARAVRFNLGTTYEAQGMVKKAVKIYESILQENIDFGDLKRRTRYLKSTSLQSMRSQALIAVAEKYGGNKIIAFWGREGKVSRGGRKEEVSQSFGQSHNHSGFEFFMKGMYKASLEEFQLAVQLDARFATALNNLGVCLIKEGRLVEAKTKLEEAVNLNPGSAIFRNNLGMVYFFLGEFEKSRRELEKALAIDPELPAVALNLGDVCYAQEEIEKAIKLYQKIGNFDILTEIVEQRLMYKVP